MQAPCCRMHVTYESYVVLYASPGRTGVDVCDRLLQCFILTEFLGLFYGPICRAVSRNGAMHRGRQYSAIVSSDFD